MRNIEKRIKNFRNPEFYQESDLNKRKEIEREYGIIEDKINAYYDKKISATELAESLEQCVWGGGEDVEDMNPSSQIYAFENLVRAIGETDSKEDVKTLFESTLYGVAQEENPMKKAYLMGILYHYSSQERLNGLRKQIKENRERDPEVSIDEKVREEIDIISSIISTAEKVRGRLPTDNKAYPKQMIEILDYIINDFPEGNEKCRAARIVGKYYAEEIHATGIPGLAEKNKDIADNPNIWRQLESCGVPRYPYILAPGQHPSQRKINESQLLDKHKVFGQNWKLTPMAGQFIGDKGEKYLLGDYSKTPPPKIFDVYLRRIRHYKDKRNYRRVFRLEEALKERLWRNLGPSGQKQIGSKENMVVIKRTIRDWPPDSIYTEAIKQSLEQDDYEAKNEETQQPAKEKQEVK